MKTAALLVLPSIAVGCGGRVTDVGPRSPGEAHRRRRERLEQAIERRGLP